MLVFLPMIFLKMAAVNNFGQRNFLQIIKLLNRQTLASVRASSSSNADNPPDISTKEKVSKAMKAYLERAKAHEDFLKQETHEFNVGKRHLANMMGSNPENFTQEDVDKSIAYLLPSGLFEKKARPLMKPPEEVFPRTKAAEFDESGRPHHYLFYTTRPNFSSLLHAISDKLEELNSFEDKMIRQQRKPDLSQQINLLGSVWMSKELLEKKVLEKLVDVEYEKFVKAMERLAAHPYSIRVKDFVDEYRTQLMAEKKQIPIAEPQVTEDGRRFVEVDDCKRKSTIGKVKLTVPGTGKITVNGHTGIDYFKSDFARNQLLFPLLFTGLVEKVDVDATMNGGGETGQSGAVRLGISMALRSFVSPEMVEKMRLAGLLTRDIRRKERKKVGQEGARRKYTWKKR